MLVTDVNGNPVSGAAVELNLFPTRYEKGFYAQFFDESGGCVGWGKVRTVNSGNAFADDADQACDNEDGNRNGILDSGEDVNNNGTLEPANIADIPGTLTTDDTGFAIFDIIYAREFTWVEVEIEARATVSGSEGFSTARFSLPGLASDFNDCEVSPPGQLSAFGQATTCACDELDDSTCPTRTSLTPIVMTLVSGNSVITAAGNAVAANTQTYSIAGGSEFSYQIVAASITPVTLTNVATGVSSSSSITVDFGQTFTLTVIPNVNPTQRTILFFAQDVLTGVITDSTAVLQNPFTTIVIARTAGTVPVADAPGAATLTFEVSGGTAVAYSVSTNFGTLSTSSTTPGTSFTLSDIEDNTSTTADRTITITVVDDPTGNVATLDITQNKKP